MFYFELSLDNGASESSDSQLSTLILVQGIWEIGPQLPSIAQNAVMLTAPDNFGVFLIGGRDSQKIMHFECKVECLWKYLPQTLSSSRQHSVAMLIPDYLAQCEGGDAPSTTGLKLD